MKIPFIKPYVGKDEKYAINEALAAGALTGNGPISRRVQKKMQTMFDIKHVLLTPSCTTALEMAMQVLEIGPDDEVILPSFTFVSTADSIVKQGGKPVFVDIDPNTMNIDPDKIRQNITERTKAIIVVHYAGVSCNMQEIMAIAREYELFVVEDAAQAVNARYNGQYLGTIGDIGCYSFHGTKNVTCGEGGAFLTNDDALAQRAEIIHEKGTNRSAFLRGQVDKYTWVSSGGSYVLSDLLAAMLDIQLNKKEVITSKRKLIWEKYITQLSSLERSGIIQLPLIPDSCESNYHIFFFRVEDEKIRNEVLEKLRNAGIEATFHYIPLHSSPFGRTILGIEKDLPITEKCSKTLVRLPIFPEMSLSDVNRIVDQINTLFLE